MKRFFKEFKDFISKGNVIDLAVAFIMGVSFKAIISSMVNDIIMPVASIFFGEEGFSNYKYVIRDAVVDADGVVTQAENAVYYGKFIQTSVDFVIIAFVMFLVVKTVNAIKNNEELQRLAFLKEEEKKVAEAPKKPTTEELLTDIKVLLENK